MTYMETGISSASDEWPTPQWLADQLAAEFGPFDLDPAATAENAKAPLFFTREDDGLRQPWHGKVWLNPPYGRTIGRWMRKAKIEVARCRADLVCCLVPARVGTMWWESAITWHDTLVRILPGRLEWQPGQQAPFTSAVIVYGVPLGQRHGAVAVKCPVCGQVFWPAYATRKTCSERCRKARYRFEVSQFRREIRDTGPPAGEVMPP